MTLGRHSKMVPNDTASCSSHLVILFEFWDGLVACDQFNMAKVMGCHLHYQDVCLADRLYGLMKQMLILETPRWKEVRVDLSHSSRELKPSIQQPWRN